jgi:hypothetical protein
LSSASWQWFLLEDVQALASPWRYLNPMLALNKDEWANFQEFDGILTQDPGPRGLDEALSTTSGRIKSINRSAFWARRGMGVATGGWRHPGFGHPKDSSLEVDIMQANFAHSSASTDGIVFGH